MRLKLELNAGKDINIPFEYTYKLHSAIYDLIRKSSTDYSKFLHDTGFIDENKHLKLFVFSRLLFDKAKIGRNGFQNVRQAVFFFSTPIPKSFEHLVLGIFSDRYLKLNMAGKNCQFEIAAVETLPEPSFNTEMKFVCLSPIAVAGNSAEHSGKHFFDYMIPAEKDSFVNGIKTNLLRKYRLVNGNDFCGDENFQFSFDPLYIVKKQGKIRKNIKFKNSRIIAMEAPFTIEADPALIRIGYDCGFGDSNSAGFGMVEQPTMTLAHSKSPDGDIGKFRPNEREK